MEVLFEIIFQIVGELLLQLVFELLAELGFRGLREPFRRRRPVHPVLAAVCYSVVGAAAGFLTLLFLPHLLITSPAGRLANLVVTPIAAGILMSLVGVWRRKRGDEIIRLDRFIDGFLFALAMSLVRFYYGSAA